MTTDTQSVPQPPQRSARKAARVAAYCREALDDSHLLRSNLGVLTSQMMDLAEWGHAAIKAELAGKPPSLQTLNHIAPALAVWQKTHQHVATLTGLLLKLEK